MPTFYVRAGLTAREPVPEAARENLLERFATVLPQHEVAPSVGILADGQTITLAYCVEASSAAPVLKSAHGIVMVAASRAGFVIALRRVVVRFVEVLDEREVDRRESEPDVPELVGVAEVAEALGVSKTRARELIREGRLGPEVGRTAAGPLHLRSYLERVAEQPRKPGRPRKDAAQPSVPA